MIVSTEDREKISDFLSYNMLCPAEAATILGIERCAVSMLIRRGTLTPIKISTQRQKYFLRSEVLQYKKHREAMMSGQKKQHSKFVLEEPSILLGIETVAECQPDKGR